MSIFPLLKVGFIMNVVAVIFVVCCVALVLIILIQKGRGGGLSAAFGGGMASGLLGSKTGDFLTWVTIVLVSIFLSLAVVMAKFYKEEPAGKFDVRPRSPTTLPTEQPPPIDDFKTTTSDTNEPKDVNLLGG